MIGKFALQAIAFGYITTTERSLVKLIARHRELFNHGGVKQKSQARCYVEDGQKVCECDIQCHIILLLPG